MHEFIALPEGYDTQVGERGVRLSGGQRHRLSMARAFLKEAPILVLDEPTSSLDATTERHVFTSLERLAQGRTTLVIAHRLATARRADRMIVLEDGAIAEQSTHAQLLRHRGRHRGPYRRLHQNQVVDLCPALGRGRCAVPPVRGARPAQRDCSMRVVVTGAAESYRET